ncbi:MULTISPECIES: tripartite tricarboxylate transporter substrate-binding protein [Ramlibacter]|uniref:tripartite tricarboxylate transporter substrate-binding protein n=1 Tax=Ramlibacter TaxID=174951 RepID=UPI0012FBCF90|nr:tripartite tricarboxylate transporter substrate binding protein [Ramlibacter sp. CGMCC 1.13660]
MNLPKILVAGALAAFALASQAAFPDKPIRIVVAFAPGSSTDVVARSLAQNLTVAFGQPVVVDNRPGAGGNIATVQVAKAAPDGYTLLVHSVAYAINPSMFGSAGYQVGDLAAVAMAGVAPNMLYVHPDVKAGNLKELTALMKKGGMSYASSGNGTTTQLGAELLFRNLLQVDVTHVPFQPAAAANAVVSGQVPIGSTSMPPVVQLARAGKVRPIAVTSLKRSPALPEVPTVAELGHPGFEANTWIALFAPAGTPTEVLDRLNTEINKVLLYKTLTENFAALSLDVVRMDRPQLTSYVAAEAAKWGGVVRRIGVKVD